MSYRPGRMGLADGLSLVLFSTMSPIFLSIYPSSVDQAGCAAWMRPGITCIEFFITLFPLLYVLQYTKGDLFSACESLLGVPATRLITLYYVAVYFADAAFLIRQYAESTLLTALPFFNFEASMALYAIMAAWILYFGIEAVARSCFLYLPFAIVSLLLIMVLASSRYNFYYLTPWNGTGMANVLWNGIKAGGFNLGALLPFFLAASFQNARTIRGTVLYGLGISTVLRTLGYICYDAAFGSLVSREKILPFFELTRLIYISRFFQRIEAFYILLWVVMGIVNIATDLYAGLYLLGRLFDLPSLRPLLLPTAIIAAQTAMLPSANVDVTLLQIQALSSYYNIGTIGIPFVLFTAALLRKRRVKACPSG